MSTDENRTASQVVPTSDEYGRRDDGGDQWYPPYASDGESPHPADLLAAQREQYGGTKIGSAFFGWLVAAGTALLLTALLAAAGTAVGAASGTTAAEATSWARADADTLGLVGAVTLAAVLFVAFGCGGYVAGRMARFDGARQGLAVWLWAVVLAVVVAGLGLGAGDRVDLPAGARRRVDPPGAVGRPRHGGPAGCCRGRGGQPLRGDPRRARRDALPPTGRRAALTRPPPTTTRRGRP